MHSFHYVPSKSPCFKIEFSTISDCRRTHVPVECRQIYRGWREGNDYFIRHYPGTPGIPLFPLAVNTCFYWGPLNGVRLEEYSKQWTTPGWALAESWCTPQVIRRIQPCTPKSVLLMHLLVWLPPMIVECGSIYFWFCYLTYPHGIHYKLLLKVRRVAERLYMALHWSVQ